MMKILFLNPHLYESPLIGTLRGLGVAAIVCADLRECELVFKLHATSISLFIGHDQDGVAMNELIKRNPRFAGTPVILTTSTWTDQQCVEHQSTTYAANAYLRLPVDDQELIHVVDQILGTELSHGKGFRVSDDLAVLELGGGLELGGLELGGLELAPANEGTRLGVLESDLAIGEPTKLSFNQGLQIEDGAALYGKPNPSTGNTLIDPSLVFSIEAPAADRNPALDASPAAELSLAGETPSSIKEFQIENTSTNLSIASEVIATPIEATSPDILKAGMDELPRVETISSIEPDPEPTPTPRAAETASSISSLSMEELDADSLAAMPYLSRMGHYPNPMAFHEPMDDAVVPGGASNAPDAETLKKYLFLREQDVTALSAQLRQAREQIGLLERQLKHERAVSTEFAHLAQEQDRRIDGFEREKAVALESAQKEFDDLKFEMKRRSEKIRVMELQVKEATEATERLKERVRNDIRKVRAREKELENRLEIMKKDSEALLGAREQKIIELKRKLDLMEFNTDLVQDILEKERVTAASLREKLVKAAQMMRVAGGLLGPDADAMTGSTRTSTETEVGDDDRTTAA